MRDALQLITRVYFWPESLMERSRRQAICDQSDEATARVLNHPECFKKCESRRHISALSGNARTYHASASGSCRSEGEGGNSKRRLL